MSGETIYPKAHASDHVAPQFLGNCLWCPKCGALYRKDEHHACASYDNHQCPPYLKADGIEYIDVVEAFVPDKPYRWPALKYLLRCGKKPGQDEVTELRKALFWIEREIAAIMKSRVREVGSGRLDGRNG